MAPKAGGAAAGRGTARLTRLQSTSASGRSSRKRISYRESSPSVSSDHESDFGEDNTSGDHEAPAERIQTRPSTRQHNHTSRPLKLKPIAIAPSPRKKRNIVQPPSAERKKRRKTTGDKPTARKANAKVSNTMKPVKRISTGIMPPWQELPYAALLDIFLFAAHRPRQERYHPSSHSAWLAKAALICKAFLEPALSALYYAPLLQNYKRLQNLKGLLASDPSKTTFNYRMKIKYLDIDTGPTPFHMVLEILKHTSQLRGIDMHLATDGLPYGASGRRAHLSKFYRPEFFRALQGNRCILRSWRWNFASSKYETAYAGSQLHGLHLDLSFRNLRDLQIAQYDGTPRDDTLANTLNLLPELKELSLELCKGFHKDFWSSLPVGLEKLRMIQTSASDDDLQAYLATRGANLRELRLESNRDIGLSFLIDLSSSCTNLLHLHIDMKPVANAPGEYRRLTTFAFLANQTPTWPPMLQSLEIVNTLKLEAKSAETLFQSIISASERLSQLRRLVIKASVDTDHRERARFRRHWIDTFESIFLRKSPPPDPSLYSKAAFAAWKKNQGFQRVAVLLPASRAAPSTKTPVKRGDYAAVLPANESDVQPEDQPHRPVLRKSRVSKGSLMMPHAESETDSDTADNSHRRSTRLKDNQDKDYLASSPLKLQIKQRVRKRRAVVLTEDESEPDSSIDDDPQVHDSCSKPVTSNVNVNAKGDGTQHIHGLCDVVDIRIDNTRPAEIQFAESDFLDPEASGDDDWNEDADDMAGDDGYAW
ncbi:hypothetical protein MMC25_006897 [Agyrium rufum]|nr:hypothetical protein [Agyrium rufum]